MHLFLNAPLPTVTLSPGVGAEAPVEQTPLALAPYTHQLFFHSLLCGHLRALRCVPCKIMYRSHVIPKCMGRAQSHLSSPRALGSHISEVADAVIYRITAQSGKNTPHRSHHACRRECGRSPPCVGQDPQGTWPHTGTGFLLSHAVTHPTCSSTPPPRSHAPRLK